MTSSIKNILDSPLCSCGMIEDNYHFFFQCPNYSQLRHILLHKTSQICIPSTQNFLHGNKYLTDTSSIRLLNAVIDFILKTKRFENYQKFKTKENTTETLILGENYGKKHTVRPLSLFLSLSLSLSLSLFFTLSLSLSHP